MIRPGKSGTIVLPKKRSITHRVQFSFRMTFSLQWRRNAVDQRPILPLAHVETIQQALREAPLLEIHQTLLEVHQTLLEVHQTLWSPFRLPIWGQTILNTHLVQIGNDP
jgi:hypothetical protein